MLSLQHQSKQSCHVVNLKKTNSFLTACEFVCTTSVEPVSVLVPLATEWMLFGLLPTVGEVMDLVSVDVSIVSAPVAALFVTGDLPLPVYDIIIHLLQSYQPLTNTQKLYQPILLTGYL